MPVCIQRILDSSIMLHIRQNYNQLSRLLEGALYKFLK